MVEKYQVNNELELELENSLFDSNNGWGNSLLPGGTKPWPEPIMIYRKGVQ